MKGEDWTLVNGGKFWLNIYNICIKIYLVNF
jgi:hypothetical protein